MTGTTIFLRSLPFDDPLIIMKGADAGKATDEFVKWTNGLTRQAGASPVAPVPAETHGAPGAGLTATVSGNFGGTLTAGLYRISAYREVLVADPVSSSLALEIQWTHNGKALVRTLAAFTGAPQTIADSAGDVTILDIDPNTTIGYTLTYASNTPALAQFQVTMLAELLQTTS